ncbi:MAG: CoA transferase [Bauldia sp.]|nr:CoA transferase [Bauldia sp.]
MNLPSEFPERALAMAARAGLGFLGSAPEIVGSDPVMRFPTPIGEAAATAMALCGDAVAEIWRRRTGEAQRPRVAVRAAAAAMAGYAFQLLQPADGIVLEGWEKEPAGWRAWGAHALLAGSNASDPAIGIYRCRDGRWIHLHGGLPHLAERIMAVLGTDRAGICAAVAEWDSEQLDEALAEARTCGAVVRSAEEWRRMEQGDALSRLPAVEVLRIGDAPPVPLPAGGAPLEGLRVLDLTTVVAGPTCARNLAQHGADVLHVCAPGRTERQPFEIDTGHGKRSTLIDLRSVAGQERLAGLATEADVFVQGYRPGAIAGLGFGPADVAALRPGIIYVSISCYGPVGPLAPRRGWEGLAQAATGLTIDRGDAPPRLAPGSVCDYITGYLAARGVLEAILRRAEEGGSWHVRTSLCQTGMWLAGLDKVDETLAPSQPDLFDDLLVRTETAYGTLRHLPPALQLDLTPPRWRRPPPLPGGDAPEWEPRAGSA